MKSTQRRSGFGLPRPASFNRSSSKASVASQEETSRRSLIRTAGEVFVEEATPSTSGTRRVSSKEPVSSEPPSAPGKRATVTSVPLNRRPTLAPSGSEKRASVSSVPFNKRRSLPANAQSTDSVSLNLAALLRKSSTMSIPGMAEEPPEEEEAGGKSPMDKKEEDDEAGGISPMDKKTLLERALQVLEVPPEDRSKKDVDILCEIAKESEFFRRHGSLARPLLEAAALESYDYGDLIIGRKEEAEAVSPLCLLLQGKVSVLLQSVPDEAGSAEPEPESPAPRPDTAPGPDADAGAGNTGNESVGAMDITRRKALIIEQEPDSPAPRPNADLAGTAKLAVGSSVPRRAAVVAGSESMGMKSLQVFDTLHTLRRKTLAISGMLGKMRQRKTLRRASTAAWNRLVLTDDRLQFVSELSAGTSFGEQSLILGLPPQDGMVVVCEEPCLLLVVRPGTFDAAQVESLVRESSLKLSFISKSLPGAQWLIDQPQGNWRLRIEKGTRLIDLPAGHVFTTQGEFTERVQPPPKTTTTAEKRGTFLMMTGNKTFKDIAAPEKISKSESTTEAMLLCKGECSLSYLAPGDSAAKSKSGEILTNVMSGHIIRGASVVADCAEPFTVVARTPVTVLAISQKLLQRLPKQLITELRQIILQQLQWVSSRAEEKLPIDDIWTALHDRVTTLNQAGGGSTVAISGEGAVEEVSMFAQSDFLRRKGLVASCPLIEGLQTTLQDVPQQELRTLVHAGESQKQNSTICSYLTQSQNLRSAERCENWQKYASRNLRRTAVRTSVSTGAIRGVPVVRKEHAPQSSFGKCMQSMHSAVGPTPANIEKVSDEKSKSRPNSAGAVPKNPRVRPSSAGAVLHSANNLKKSTAFGTTFQSAEVATEPEALEFQRPRPKRPMSAVEKLKRADFLVNLMEGIPALDSAAEGALGQMVEMQEMSRSFKTIRQRIDTGRKLQHSRPSSAFGGREFGR